MEDCPICHSEIKGKVFMTCSSKHAFCFECILKSVESSKELKNCPMCRGGGENKYILIDSNTVDENPENFYSISRFKKSFPIIQRILKVDVSQNSCLVSDKLLLTYVKNKKQLEFADILSRTFPIDEIIPLIRWNKGQEISGELSDLMGAVATEIFLGSLPERGAPFQQFMRF